MVTEFSELLYRYRYTGTVLGVRCFQERNLESGDPPALHCTCALTPVIYFGTVQYSIPVVAAYLAHLDHDVFCEQVVRVGERLEFQAIAARVPEKHGPLLPRLARKAQVRLQASNSKDSSR